MVATVQCPACRLAFSWRMQFTPKTSACGLYTSSDGCSSLKRSESMSNRMWVFRLWICLGHLLGASLISPVFICMGGCSLNGLLVGNMQGAFDRDIDHLGKAGGHVDVRWALGQDIFCCFHVSVKLPEICKQPTNVLWAPFDNGSALMVWFFHYFAEIASYWHFSTALSSDTGESWHWDATSQLSSPVRGMHSVRRVAPRSMARAYPVSAAQCHQPFLHRDDEGIHSGGHWIHLSGHCKFLILNWIFLLAWNKNAGVGLSSVTWWEMKIVAVIQALSCMYHTFDGIYSSLNSIVVSTLIYFRVVWWMFAFRNQKFCSHKAMKFSQPLCMAWRKRSQGMSFILCHGSVFIKWLVYNTLSCLSFFFLPWTTILYELKN